MMFEWYSIFAMTRRPARVAARAKVSADTLMPPPCGPPMSQVRSPSRTDKPPTLRGEVRSGGKCPSFYYSPALEHPSRVRSDSDSRFLYATPSLRATSPRLTSQPTPKALSVNRRLRLGFHQAALI